MKILAAHATVPEEMFSEITRARGFRQIPIIVHVKNAVPLSEKIGFHRCLNFFSVAWKNGSISIAVAWHQWKASKNWSNAYLGILGLCIPDFPLRRSALLCNES